jgi:hypothetical protein
MIMVVPTTHILMITAVPMAVMTILASPRTCAQITEWHATDSFTTLTLTIHTVRHALMTAMACVVFAIHLTKH